MADEKTFEAKLFEFYKESYEAELENKEKMTARLTFNLGILTIIANICVSFLSDAPAYRTGWMVAGFYVAFGTGIVLGLTSLILFFKAVGFPFGYAYRYIPKTTELERYLRELEKYNEAVPSTDKIDIERTFTGNLMLQYASHAGANAEKNEIRARFTYVAFEFSILSVIALLLCAPLFFTIKFSSGKPPQRVEITAPIQIK